MIEATPGSSARLSGCLLAATVFSGGLFAPPLCASENEDIFERAFGTFAIGFDETETVRILDYEYVGED